MPVDVQAKRRYAQQRAIMDKYAPFIGQRVGPYVVTNAGAEDRMHEELREMERQWGD